MGLRIHHFFGGISLLLFSLACWGVTLLVSLLLTLPDGPKLLHLLLELCHHAKQIFHLLTPHAGGIPAALLRQQQAQALPEARYLNNHILGQDLGLDCYSLRGTSLLLPGGDHGKCVVLVTANRQASLPGEEGQNILIN